MGPAPCRSRSRAYELKRLPDQTESGIRRVNVTPLNLKGLDFRTFGGVLKCPEQRVYGMQPSHGATTVVMADSEGWAASRIAVQLDEIDIYRTAWGLELCERRADLGQRGVHGNTRDWVKKSSHRKRRNQDG